MGRPRKRVLRTSLVALGDGPRLGPGGLALGSPTSGPGLGGRSGVPSTSWTSPVPGPVPRPIGSGSLRRGPPEKDFHDLNYLDQSRGLGSGTERSSDPGSHSTQLPLILDPSQSTFPYKVLRINSLSLVCTKNRKHGTGP